MILERELWGEIRELTERPDKAPVSLVAIYLLSEWDDATREDAIHYLTQKCYPTLPHHLELVQHVQAQLIPAERRRSFTTKRIAMAVWALPELKHMDRHRLHKDQALISYGDDKILLQWVDGEYIIHKDLPENWYEYEVIPVFTLAYRGFSVRALHEKIVHRIYSISDEYGIPIC